MAFSGTIACPVIGISWTFCVPSLGPCSQGQLRIGEVWWHLGVQLWSDHQTWARTGLLFFLSARTEVESRGAVVVAQSKSGSVWGAVIYPLTCCAHKGLLGLVLVGRGRTRYHGALSFLRHLLKRCQDAVVSRSLHICQVPCVFKYAHSIGRFCLWKFQYTNK